MTVGTSNVVIFCICLLVVVAVVALIVNKTFFKQLVIKFRGRTEEVVRQDASTPDGARDYFNNAIREKETLYSNAERSYTEIAGKLDEAEKEQYDLKKELMKIDKSINSCFDSGDEENARQYAMKKVTVQGKINTLKETIEEYKKQKNSRKKSAMQLSRSLMNSKKKKKEQFTRWKQISRLFLYMRE